MDGHSRFKNALSGKTRKIELRDYSAYDKDGLVYSIAKPSSSHLTLQPCKTFSNEQAETDFLNELTFLRYALKGSWRHVHDNGFMSDEEQFNNTLGGKPYSLDKAKTLILKLIRAGELAIFPTGEFIPHGDRNHHQPPTKTTQADLPSNTNGPGNRKAPLAPPPTKTTPPERKIITLEAGDKGGWNKELNKPLDPDTDYKVGPYLYQTDADGRVSKVSGTLDLETKSRNTYQQGKSADLDGIKDGIPEDDGGHLIASIFNGPGEQINYLPMNSNLNRGEWKSMENE